MRTWVEENPVGSGTRIARNSDEAERDKFNRNNEQMSWGIYFTLPSADGSAPVDDGTTVYAAFFDHHEDADLALRLATKRPLDSELLDQHMMRYADFYQTRKPAYLFEPATEWLNLFAQELSHLRHLVEEGRGKLSASLRQGELFENTSRVIRPGE